MWLKGPGERELSSSFSPTLGTALILFPFCSSFCSKSLLLLAQVSLFPGLPLGRGWNLLTLPLSPASESHRGPARAFPTRACRPGGYLEPAARAGFSSENSTATRACCPSRFSSLPARVIIYSGLLPGSTFVYHSGLLSEVPHCGDPGLLPKPPTSSDRRGSGGCRECPCGRSMVESTGPQLAHCSPPPITPPRCGEWTRGYPSYASVPNRSGNLLDLDSQ